jgi:hypothetical protein
MQVDVRPYDDQDAWAVIRQLDAHDLIEAELVRGAHARALGLWADWRSIQPAQPLSFVASTGGIPFAVFGVMNTGQAGVGAASLLARDHRRFRRPLARLCGEIRRRMPGHMAELGIHRIECRCWNDHPTAALLLSALGFRHECDMPGFGLTGSVTFRQFAWLAQTVAPKPNQEN